MLQRIFTIALLASCSAIGLSYDHTIDFESFSAMAAAPGLAIPAESRLSNQLQSSIGISFRSNAPYVAVVDLGLGHATSGTRGIGGSTVQGTLSYLASTPIDFTFWVPTNTSVAAGTNSFSVRGDMRGALSNMTLTAYDFNNNVVDTLTVRDTGGNTMVLNSATKNIHRVRFFGTGNVALDDAQFNSVEAVPEPATLTAMGLGLLAMLRRRRQNGTA